MHFLATSTMAAKSNSTVTAVQDGSRLNPSLDALGPRPVFRNREIESFIEPRSTPSSSEDLADESNQVGTQLDTNGKLAPDASDATATSLVRESQEDDVPPDTFLALYWPYLLLAVTFFGWVIYQSFLKQPPSYKHRVMPPKQIDDASELKGHFKVAQRFQKTESNEDKTNKVAEVKSSPKVEPVEEPKVELRENGRPADNEFEVGFDSDLSDSDIIDEHEAAEIVKQVDTRQTEVRGPRFKTEVEQSNVSAEDTK